MTTVRKNQFEELIDAMMIDEVAGIDQDIREALENLDTDKKRMAILSILDKDRDMFLKIKGIVGDNDVTKTEHIKEVVSMLRSYVEVGDREQKQYGEVFTKYWTISEMLDLIPAEDWSNPNLKFLDSCAGAGNFPAVIIERLMNGLSEVFTNEEERYTHIVENMIHMAELQAKNAFLILAALDPQDIYELNIFNGSFLLDEFDEHSKEVWGVEKYDYVIQNPPYQELIEGNNIMKPLYHTFIEKALKISDKLISIHPSRWMTGGMGLSKFRKMMLNKTDIKSIKHWNDSQEVFGKHVDIRGGIQYFLIDKNHNGLTKYNGVECKLNEFDIFVEPIFHAIIKKLVKYESLYNLYLPEGKVFLNIRTNDKKLSNIKENENFIKCYVSKSKGFEKFVDRTLIKNQPVIDSYKVIVTEASGKGGDGFGNKFIGYPSEAYSGSYICFYVNSEEEAKSLLSYMNTKFCNFMLSLRKKTHHTTGATTKFIPMVPFDREWNNEMLFEYFELTEEEKELILNK